MGQHRLAYGRLRHGMHNVAMAQRALDMAAEHVTNRSTFGQRLADRQGVQWMLADCASELYIARLMLLHIAYKAENGMDLRQENSIAKVYLAHMVHKVVDTAIQLHGALGYSQDTPLARWYTQIRAQRLVDGPDEVHRWTVGRNVIKAYEHGTTAARRAGICCNRRFRWRNASSVIAGRSNPLSAWDSDCPLLRTMRNCFAFVRNDGGVRRARAPRHGRISHAR